ncbi:MAG: Do family serine endopeptidase [Acidobacteria bacterium]|nr:Do family serine endopeptidase [Acidobacteriota bacterium]
MRKNGQLITLVLIAAASVVFGMGLAGGLNLTLPGQAAISDPAEDRPLHAAARAQHSAVLNTGNMPGSFADIVDRVNPAVVSITAVERVQGRGEKGRRPFHGDPFEFFFGPPRRRSPGEPEEDRFEQSGGSGFLISDDGYILTNYHVIEDATQIRVILSGDLREYDAEVIGSDPSTDLSLIKIEVDSRLPHLEMGDSDRMRVGDWVLAVGNPLNYDHTVTVGVVSAKGRYLQTGLGVRDVNLDDFIQTDAAINFGNSGGPLVNVQGEVIGVNTAISSIGQGIGFAVPINIARNVIDQLRATGKVARGFLGIQLGVITPELQEAWRLENDHGAIVQSVTPGLPAEAAGVERGDIIIAVDGEPIRTTKQVVRLVSAKRPGETVKLKIVRGGEEVVLSAELIDRPPPDQLTGGRSSPGLPGGEDPHEKTLGISVDAISPSVLNEIELPSETTGVIITRVSRVSKAYEQGLNRGDVIVEVNRVPIDSVADYRRELRKIKSGGLIVFYVTHPPARSASNAATSRYVTVRMEGEE